MVPPFPGFSPFPALPDSFLRRPGGLSAGARLSHEQLNNFAITSRRARTLSGTAMPLSLQDILWPLSQEQAAYVVDLYKSSSADLPQALFAERASDAVNAKFKRAAGASMLSRIRITKVWKAST